VSAVAAEFRIVEARQKRMPRRVTSSIEQQQQQRRRRQQQQQRRARVGLVFGSPSGD